MASSADSTSNSTRSHSQFFLICIKHLVRFVHSTVELCLNDFVCTKDPHRHPTRAAVENFKCKVPRCASETRPHRLKARNSSLLATSFSLKMDDARCSLLLLHIYLHFCSPK